MIMKLTEKEEKARKRVCLALDGIENVDSALALASELSIYVGMAKIGKELHTIAGNEGRNILGEVSGSGMNSFLDLKYHDTPQTVFAASRASAVKGVYMFNIHLSGGEAMCKKAVQGSYEGAKIRGVERPNVIGVTELTSLNTSDLIEQGIGINYDDLVRRRTELARKWGLDGVVCPANKAGALEREFGSDFLYVTPGVTWSGRYGDGQKQIYTPDKAVKDCRNSVLVIGSAITTAGNVAREGKLLQKGTAQDRQTAAYEILQAMAPNL